MKKEKLKLSFLASVGLFVLWGTPVDAYHCPDESLVLSAVAAAANSSFIDQGLKWDILSSSPLLKKINSITLTNSLLPKKTLSCEYEGQTGKVKVSTFYGEKTLTFEKNNTTGRPQLKVQSASNAIFRLMEKGTSSGA